MKIGKIKPRMGRWETLVLLSQRYVALVIGFLTAMLISRNVLAVVLVRLEYEAIPELLRPLDNVLYAALVLAIVLTLVLTREALHMIRAEASLQTSTSHDDEEPSATSAFDRRHSIDAGARRRDKSDSPDAFGAAADRTSDALRVVRRSSAR